MQDADRLAEFQRHHEGYEQARRLMLGQHAPDELVKDHQRFLQLSSQDPISKDEAFARARETLARLDRQQKEMNVR